MRKYTEKELDSFFEDNAIEMDALSDFLDKVKNLNMELEFDAPTLIVKLELEDA